MTISKEDALQKAVESLMLEMKNRLKIVDCLPNDYYGLENINVEEFWIFHVKPDEPILDGYEKFILVNKETGRIRY